ncbi:hypothetical protein MNBD_GAMMA12-852 [hydrothermal vent metagenome]|uniref:Uncharacterized protein n=1 Tax=hydrothermal vent metagenome TaxID=652676 RepID=A0A3B0YID0_9ZZZZ
MNVQFLNFEINQDDIINFPKNILASNLIDVGNTVLLHFNGGPVLAVITMIDNETIIGRLLCDVYDDQDIKLVGYDELIQFYKCNIDSILDARSDKQAH